MKNISLILNIVLLLAVGFLYVKVFSGAKTAQPAAAGTESGAEPLKVVYVNADTLLENYDYFKEQREALQKKETDADASLKAKGRAFENEMRQIQQKIQQGLLAPNDIQREEQRMAQKQQQLMAEQEQMQRTLLEESQKINEALQKELLDKLKSIKETEGYDFIFSYASGGQILVANDSLDITQRVVKELNTERKEATKKQ